METSFRKWLEAGNMIEPPKSEPDLPYASPYDITYKKTGPGKNPMAGQTNAMQDAHGPESQENPPIPGLNEPKMMSKKAARRKKRGGCCGWLNAEAF